MPKLSVIIPVYNKVSFLETCLQSVISQTLSDLEIILINDGSTDGSDLVCERFAKADNRIIFLTQNNGGVSSARNAGLNIASGEYIGFIDSDDIIESDMYELLIHNIINFNADISVCRMKVVYPDKLEAPVMDNSIKSLDSIGGLKACLNGELDRSANNKIYRAELAKSAFFEGSIYEDILYITRLFLLAQLTVVQNSVKYSYMVRDNSVSMRKFNINYVQTIDVSAKIVELVNLQCPDATKEAEIFDIVANLSLLNLVLLTGKNNFKEIYNRVVLNLNSYSHQIKESQEVRRKHKIAYVLFSYSPRLYTWLLKTYGKITNADLLKRT